MRIRLMTVCFSLILAISACLGSEEGQDEALPLPGVPATLSIQGEDLEIRMVEIDADSLRPGIDRAYLGRLMQAEDFGPNAVSVVVLSNPLWEALGSNPAVIGERIFLAGRELSVIGVTPPGFPPENVSMVWTQSMVGGKAP